MNPSSPGAQARALDLLADPGQEQRTTKRILPQLDAILDRVRRAREAFDLEFYKRHERRKASPAMFGTSNPDNYPVGYCLQIRDGVFARLGEDLEFIRLIGTETRFKPIHILLRGMYFQNAIQLGNLYLDSANDTVDTRKDKIEWSHIRELDYENCDSWSAFIRVAERYLGVRAYPNLAFPLLFPAAPVLMIRPNGRLDLLQQAQIFAKDIDDELCRAESLLKNRDFMTRKLPVEYLAPLERAFSANLHGNFPFEYAPADEKTLSNVLKEFRGLATLPQEPRYKTIAHYLASVNTAETALCRADIRPDDITLQRLRENGAIPSVRFNGPHTSESR